MDETREPGQQSSWLLLRGQDVPDQWRARAERLHLVPLLPSETEMMLRGGPAGGLEVQDERLLSLLAGGLRVDAIARELGVSRRSVDRRLARLRERFGVASKAELTRLAAGWGFGR